MSAQIEPELDTVALQTASLFPATFATDRCGEFAVAQVDEVSA